MTRSSSLSLRDVARSASPDGSESVELLTDRGTIACRLHDAPHGDTAVLWVFGSGGGLGGPAGGVYARLGRALAGEGLASLEVDYRRPGDLAECVLDALMGIAFLEMLGRSRTVLVGHSFGGAVVITAGAASDRVIAVAALSSQTMGTGAVGDLSPRPLLLVHGTQDEILPAACSQDIHARAGEPRELVLYPGCRHGLDACRDRLDQDLTRWIRGVVSPPS